MDPIKFFNKLKQLGTYKCFSYKRYSKRSQKTEANWHSHFGHCLNNHYHYCRFLLNPKPIVYMVHYQRKLEVDGVMLRMRSNSVQQRDFRTGRPGRPTFKPNHCTKNKNPQ